MNISPNIELLVENVNKSSGGSLQQPTDLARLLELARQAHKQSVLAELALLGTFLAKTYELMKKIGEGSKDYEKLSLEFSNNLVKSQNFIRVLIEHTSEETQTHFTTTYLTLHEQTLHNLMKLFHDLRWYKNYQIDNRQTS